MPKSGPSFSSAPPFAAALMAAPTWALTVAFRMAFAETWRCRSGHGRGASFAGWRGVSNGQALRPVRNCWQHVVPPVGQLAAPGKRCDWKSTLGSGAAPSRDDLVAELRVAEKDLRSDGVVMRDDL